MVAKVEGGVADSIHFATQSGTMVMAAKGKTAGTSQLLMAGTGDDALKAWYLEPSDTTKTKVQAGQLNLVAYDKQVIEVCLVGVNNASVPNAINIENELNCIYAPAVVQWKVTNAPKLEMQLDGEFDNLHADKMMDYSASEKQVRDAYIKQEGDHFDKSKFYLFLVENKTKDPSIDGFMPFNRQFGFIYCAGFDISKIDKEIRTMAHELGHGAFRLRHTFSKDNKFVQEKGTTDNLMDYVNSSPTVLRKYQWDGVRQFHFGINWFEDGEEALSMSSSCPKGDGSCVSVLEILNRIKSIASSNKKNVFFIVQEKQRFTENLTLNNTKFKTVLISINPDAGKSACFDYSNYLLTSGIITFYSNDNKALVTISVQDDNNLNLKMSILKKYIFGNNTGIVVKDKIEQIVPDDFFEPQGFGDCLATCRNILTIFYASKGQTYNKQTENWVLGTNLGENTTFKIHAQCNLKAIQDFDSKLDAHIPVIVGVDWKAGELKITKTRPEGYYPNQDDGITV